ncbi:hypothetical protein H9P43_002122 [Blastocladiella emersonii ATCC 22665]|nr:hypothetical protein H9P43_002122 [Blastocladiella emersonii ATCC 22665]
MKRIPHPDRCLASTVCLVHSVTATPIPSPQDAAASPATTGAGGAVRPIAIPPLVTPTRTYFDLPVTVCLATATISLTFNGGPHAILTPRYLDLLKELKIQATFFVTGSHINATTAAILRRAEEEGHLLGFSSWSDPIFPDLTQPQLVHEVNDTADALAAVRGGFPPLYFRFPRGQYTPAQLAYVSRQGFLPVQWSLDVIDTDLVTDSGLGNVAHAASNTSSPASAPSNSSAGDALFVRWQQKLSPLAASHRYIAVAHDSAKVTLSRLRQLVALARGRGYTFLRLDDCLERDTNALKEVRRRNGLGNGSLVATPNMGNSNTTSAAARWSGGGGGAAWRAAWPAVVLAVAMVALL